MDSEEKSETAAAPAPEAESSESAGQPAPEPEAPEPEVPEASEAPAPEAAPAPEPAASPVPQAPAASAETMSPALKLLIIAVCVFCLAVLLHGCLTGSIFMDEKGDIYIR